MPQMEWWGLRVLLVFTGLPRRWHPITTYRQFGVLTPSRSFSFYVRVCEPHGCLTDLILDINSRPVSLCDLHRLIDIQFSSSSFGKNVSFVPVTADQDSPVYLRTTVLWFSQWSWWYTSRYAVQLFLVRQIFIVLLKGTRRSPRKLEMKPVYVLNVLIPSGEVDNGFDPTKTIVALKVRFSIEFTPCILTHRSYRIKILSSLF